VPPPEFLLDRSLGRHQLADALRAEGFVVHTLWSVYGAAEERLHEWAADAGSLGWNVLTADKRLRYTVSSLLLVTHQVGIFQLARGNLSGSNQVRWYVDNLEAIRLACNGPRPFILNVHELSIARIWP
jgi:predicted nuclease of predicted toxin-antitoxin system